MFLHQRKKMMYLGTQDKLSRKQTGYTWFKKRKKETKYFQAPAKK